jgi:phenylpropionate dioxygenase-like ring-hydroxylating dioxygenase large terminal subunit
MSMNDLPQNLWYPLFLAHEIDQRPRRFERFGVQWVVCRLNVDTLLMAEDRCPHLGASLAEGTILEGRIQCPFHGFCFDAKGRCTKVPALGAQGRIPEKLHLRTLPLREVQGWIWGWWGENDPENTPIPVFTEFDHQWRWRDIASDWSVHVTRAIENQLDVAHLPFVHRRSIGAGGRALVEGPYVEADPEAIKVWVTNRRDDGTPPRSLDSLAAEAKDHPPNLEFRFPGLWQLRIHSKLRLLVAFVPVHAQQTRFYVRACHQVHIPLLGALYSRILGLSNRWILGEDERVVSRITPASSLDADDDHLIAADRAIILFRKLWRRHLEHLPNDVTP